MSDTPLHVKVAEALGWTDFRPCGNIAAPWVSFTEGHAPGWVPIIGRPEEGWETVPRYDLDWSAAGPLIERFPICVFQREGGWAAFYGKPADVYLGELYFDAIEQGTGPTPLVAACDLILALHEAGKLKAA